MSKEHLRRERDRGLQVITAASSPLGLAVTAVSMGTGADAADALTLGERAALLEALMHLQFRAITALGRHLRVHSRAGSVGLAGQGGVAGDGRAALVPSNMPSEGTLPLGSARLQMNQPKNPPYQPVRHEAGRVGGRDYSGHALDRMQDRGIMPTVVENTISAGMASPGRAGATVYYDSVNNVSVVVNQQGKVVTVRYGRK